VKVLSQRRSSCCRAMLGTSSLRSSSFPRVGENNCVVQLRTPNSRFEDEFSFRNFEVDAGVNLYFGGWISYSLKR
jgi:hypothetical protein